MFCSLLHLSSHLKLCDRSGRICLFSPPVLSGYNGSLDTRISRGTMRLMSWPDGEHYSCPLQSLVATHFLSLVSTLLLFRTGGVQSHVNSLTRMFPRFSPRNLCSLVTLAVFFSRLRCNGNSLLLGSCFSRNGRSESPSCSPCGHLSQDTSHLILHCSATDSLRRSLFGDSLSLYMYDLWSRPWKVIRLLGLHGFPPCFIPGKGSGN